MVGVVIAFIFWISLIIGVVVFWPFLPHMPIVLNFFLREYEFECNILRVLDMARFDTKRKDGWMAPLEILYAVEKMSGRQPSVSAIYVTLGKLRREGAVTSKKVPAEYLKKPPKRAKVSGVSLAFKLENNSNYKPRKPKWLPKEQKKESKGVVGGVTAH
ncbi:MAG: hypothetical protein ACKUBY_03150 [Candidatus Moraniibacteriota bacterium]